MLVTKQLRALAAALLFAVAPAALFLASEAAVAQATAPAATDSAAPAAPAADASATGGDADHAVVENPYGIEAMVKGGDWVTRTVLVILIIMSFGSWYIMVTKVWEQSRLYAQAREANKVFWNAPTYKRVPIRSRKAAPSTSSPVAR